MQALAKQCRAGKTIIFFDPWSQSRQCMSLWQYMYDSFLTIVMHELYLTSSKLLWILLHRNQQLFIDLRKSVVYLNTELYEHEYASDGDMLTNSEQIRSNNARRSTSTWCITIQWPPSPSKNENSSCQKISSCSTLYVPHNFNFQNMFITSFFRIFPKVVFNNTFRDFFTAKSHNYSISVFTGHMET